MPQIKVLIPLDGSEFAERAIDLLPALGGLGDLYVRLIGAIDEQELESLPQSQEWMAKEERLLREHLELKKTELEASDMLAGFEVHRGNPARVILDAADRFKPDYIVMSSHSRAGVERLRLGSVADKVIRNAGSNILIVGPSSISTRTAIRNVMVPLDGSKLAEAALVRAIELTRAADARLHVVRVATHPAFADDAGWAWKAVQDAAEAYLAATKAEIDLGDVLTAMPLGQPAEELRKYAQAQHIDLTVMTTHGRGGFLRAAFGSVADALTSGRTPVLIMKSGLP